MSREGCANGSKWTKAHTAGEAVQSAIQSTRNDDSRSALREHLPAAASSGSSCTRLCVRVRALAAAAAAATSSHRHEQRTLIATMDATARKTKKQQHKQQALGHDADVPAFASEGLRRRRKDTSGREYDEVDDRITIPLAAPHRTASHRIGVTVTTSSSSSSSKSHSSNDASSAPPRTSEAILQSGLSKYRSLSGKATAPTTASSTTTTTTTTAASTTTSPTVVVPGASLKVPSESASDARGLQHPARVRSTPSHHRSHRAAPPELSPYDHAMRLMDQKQHAAAIPYFTQALAHLSSAGFSSASGNTGQQSALRIYYHRGVCLLAAQKCDKAIEDFTRVITMTPKRAQLFAKRARAYAQLSHYTAALSDYNEAIELLSSTSSTASVFADAPSSRADLRSLFVARARVFVALNDSHRALDDLARAESADGQRDADVYYTRARVLMARGDDRLALQDLDRFLELQDDALAHHDIVVSDNCSPSTSRTEALERMQDVRFDRAKLLLTLAAAQERAFETDADVLAIEEGDARAKSAGRSGYQSPEATALVLRAVADYSVLLDVASASLNVSEVLLKRSDALGRIGRFDDALSDLDRAQTLAPHDFEVRLARATLYQTQGDLRRAIDEVTAVLQLNGFFVDALFFRAALYEQTGAFAKAQRDYTSIIEAHYDLSGESFSEDAGVATEQTPLLGKGSSSSSSKSKSPAAPAKPHKILSQYSKRALLLRARVHATLERFDDAIADYERIQQSFPNELEPQLELPDVIAKKDAWGERTRLEAVEALLAREDEEQRDAKRAPASKKKKKKKSKKSKSKSRATPADAGYVLLPDDDMDDEPSSDKVESVENGSVENAIDTVENATESTANPLPHDVDATLTEARTRTSTDSAATAEVPVSVDTAPAGRKTRSARPSPTASVTRDEACESMWEQVDDAIEDVRTAPTASVSQAPATAPSAAADSDDAPPSTAARASHRYPTDDDTDGGSVSDERLGESGDDSASDASRHTDALSSSATAASSSAGTAATAPSSVREVLVDKKYLLKRERQLKNVRMDLLAACDARDRVAIDEVLERAERKQMTESLEDEIRRAKDVLARLDQDAESDGDARGNAPDIDEVDTAMRAEAPQDDPAPVASPVAAAPLATSIDSAESDSAETPLSAAPASASSPSVAATLHKHRAHRQPSLSSSPRDSDAPAAAATTTPSKPPSLVIRPIAYGHALQLAEQSQHQFAQTQRLLIEKDAEIAALRQLLAQSQRDAAIERFDACDSGDIARRVSTLRAQFPSKELRDACGRIDALVHWLGPTDDADVTRRKVLAFVHRVLEAANFALGAPILVFPTGSFPMKTYLPTADLDVCLLLPQELEPTWHFPVLHALCLAGSAASSGSSGGGVVGASGAVTSEPGAPNALSGSPNGKSASPASGLSGYATNTVRNVNFINADVRVIKCTIDNISVDFTANRVGALSALLLLDAMAARVGKDHLLKKSIVLIKAWCIHESSAYTAAPHGSPAQPHTTGAAAHAPSGHSVLGASYGAFSTYAINTVVMGLFNQHGAKIVHPLHALFLFLDRMAEFPWHDAALTLHGSVPLSVLASGASVVSTQAMLFKKKAQASGSRKSDAGDVYSAKLSLDDVEHIRQRTQDHFGGFGAAQPPTANGFNAKPAFQLRAVNIVDPLDEKNNLARSVSAEWFPAMKRAFRMGRNRLARLLASPKTAPPGGVSRIDELDDFFATSWRTYGRGDGWRPDLLVHPRQVWHGKASSGSSSAGGSGSSGGGRSSGDGQTDDLRWQSILPELVPMAANPYQQPQPQAAMYYAPQYAYHHPHVHHVSSPAHGSGGNGGVPVGLGLSEPLPYPSSHHSHQRRSFDSSSSSSKTSPLKSMTSLRHRSASSMATTAVYSNGSNGVAKAVRPYDAQASSAMSPGRQQQQQAPR